MKAQQIIDITEIEEHEEGCFSLVSVVDHLEIEIWVDSMGQIDSDSFIIDNGQPVELSKETLQELESYLNNIGLAIESQREREALEDKPNEVDCFEARKLKLTA